MADFEFFALILCLIVFFVLTIVFGVMFFLIVKLTKRSVLAGFEDERLKKTYLKGLGKKDGKILKVAGRVFNILLGVLGVAVFAFSMIIKCSDNNVTKNVPTLRVVESGSMSYKNESNKYLFTNELDDQIQTFDLILTNKLPSEMELELYDIVVYEYDGKLLIHRIVGIEEPNEKHPDCRYFLLQGDANVYPDRFPVKYEQMRAIYQGQRCAYIGSVFSFFQSPAGYLCILLILVYAFGMPFIEKKITLAEDERLSILLKEDKVFKLLINQHYMVLKNNYSFKED